jgi:REP element-mobilizing transposase RayT
MRQSRGKQKQLSLDLGRSSSWYNRGGRPTGPNPRVRHLSRQAFPETDPCHVTLKVAKRVGSLRRKAIVREIEDSFREANERGDFRLVVYSIQRDHAHLIVEAKSREALGRGMKALASRLARAVNRVLGRSGKVLRDRYHLQVLTNPRQVWNAISYVLCNARRHEKKHRDRLARSGVVVPLLESRGTLDGASSARWFGGWRPDVPIDRSPPSGLGWRSVVAQARTWLLREGWQRYGFLDPNAIPGSLA